MRGEQLLVPVDAFDLRISFPPLVQNHVDYLIGFRYVLGGLWHDGVYNLAEQGNVATRVGLDGGN